MFVFTHISLTSGWVAVTLILGFELGSLRPLPWGQGVWVRSTSDLYPFLISWSLGAASGLVHSASPCTFALRGLYVVPDATALWVWRYWWSWGVTHSFSLPNLARGGWPQTPPGALLLVQGSSQGLWGQCPRGQGVQVRLMSDLHPVSPPWNWGRRPAGVPSGNPPFHFIMCE